MSNLTILQRILDAKLIAILRADSGEQLLNVSQALVSGGIEIIEVTFTTPGAADVVKAVKSELGDEIVMGGGTILDPETARTAILAGAEFIVAPNTNPAVIQMCKRYSVPVMPGAFSPTEIVAAWEAGADVVKIFPSNVLGPGYLKAVKGPLPQVRMMPTGGVDLDTIADFFQAGACSVGLGSALVTGKQIAEGDWSGIEETARKFVERVATLQMS